MRVAATRYKYSTKDSNIKNERKRVVTRMLSVLVSIIIYQITELKNSKRRQVIMFAIVICISLYISSANDILHSSSLFPAFTFICMNWKFDLKQIHGSRNRSITQRFVDAQNYQARRMNFFLESVSLSRRQTFAQ